MYIFYLMSIQKMYTLVILGALWMSICGGVVGQRFYDARAASQSIAPLPTHGSCESGKRYVINSYEDLVDRVDELPCIWSVGLAPQAVPLGAVPGQLLALLNTARYNPIANSVYQGDFVVETLCNGKTFYMGFLQAGGRTVSTGKWYIGRLPVDVVPTEYSDDKDGLILDFSSDIRRECGPEDVSKYPLALTMLPRKAPWNSNIWPIRTFVDQVRIVGRQKNGELLMLGRTFQTDESRPNEPAVTAWYFLLRTTDPSVLPQFAAGTPIGPTEEFEFYHTGVAELAHRLIPKSSD